jgi:choline dehydrogenase-like flavoprotein
MTLIYELGPNPRFDYVIVGGGTAGCVIASRLAESLPHATILLIEGGDSDFANEEILNLRNLVNLWTSDEYDYGYRSVPQEFGKACLPIPDPIPIH